MSLPKVKDLLLKFNQGNRSALAKAITLVESSSSLVKEKRIEFLQSITPKKRAIKIAVSGPPGVGKSSFIDLFGLLLTDLGLSLAVLPIDPSSDINHGSILADKTRMKKLMSLDSVFIRPSASRNMLGGIAPNTDDVIYVMESFGFDVIIIETVGVGQSETTAYNLTDYFLLLLSPDSGDIFQAMKKGVLERADFFLVNKSDGEQKATANVCADNLRAMLDLSDNKRYLSTISVKDNIGVKEFVKYFLALDQGLYRSGEIKKRRDERIESQLLNHLNYMLWKKFKTACLKSKVYKEILLEFSHNKTAMSPVLSKFIDNIIFKI